MKDIIEELEQRRATARLGGGEARIAAPKQERPGQGGREEGEEERVGVEQHRPLGGILGPCGEVSCLAIDGASGRRSALRCMTWPPNPERRR